MASSVAELRDWDPNVLSQNFNVLTGEYREWRDDDKYMLFQFSNYDTNTVSYKLVKGSKRGNDVYNFRLREKLRPLLEIRHLPGISGSFLTLTCDIKEFSSWSDAWPIIIKEWNRFLTWLKKHYKGSLYGVVRCFEATKRGYPHIHAVLLWKGNNPVYIPKLRLFDEWKHFVKINVVRDLGGAVGYILKYMSKTVGGRDDSMALTPAVLCYHRKQSYSVTRALFDLIQSICEIQTKDQKNMAAATKKYSNLSRQCLLSTYSGDKTGLDPPKNDDIQISLLGFFRPDEFNLDGKKWVYGDLQLTKEMIDMIYDRLNSF